ncbi:MAG: hypothetical protein OJF49_004707 [Ktedonobacterales bacterium]|nr:MAG: hypothetical protein OJF49_004707 [Ktedonobacterales bacterium]
MLGRIFITGALKNGSADRAGIYKSLVETCSRYSQQIYSPLDSLAFQNMRTDLYRSMIFAAVARANLLIAECSVPSLDTGMEIQEAVRINVPMIVVAEAGTTISKLVQGSTNIRQIIYYANLDDLKYPLAQELEDFIAERA